MFLHYGGRYRKNAECKILEQVKEELTKFEENSEQNSVLVFPPLAAQYRFLIHQVAEEHPSFQSVSIGQGVHRRTVVYRAKRRESHEMAQSSSAVQRTFFGRGRARRSKRPDQALYIPGAMRQARQEQQEQSSSRECSTNKADNNEISQNVSQTVEGSSRVTNDVPLSDLSNGSDCSKTDKFNHQQYDEAIKAESTNGITPPLCSEAEGVSKDAGGTFTEEQRNDMQSQVSADQRQRTQNPYKDCSESVGNADVNQTLLGAVFVSNTSESLQIREKSIEEPDKISDTCMNSQTFSKEPDSSKCSFGNQDAKEKSMTKEAVLDSECFECVVPCLSTHGSFNHCQDSVLKSLRECSVGKDQKVIASGGGDNAVDLSKKDSESGGVNREHKVLLKESITTCENVTAAVLLKPSCLKPGITSKSDLMSRGNNNDVNDAVDSEECPQHFAGGISSECKENMAESKSNGYGSTDISNQEPQVPVVCIPPCLTSSEKSVNIVEAASDILHPIFSSNTTHLENDEEKCMKKPFESGSSPESPDVELHQSVETEELQTELCKSCTNKKKKSKKEKSKDEEEKTKSKEKKEKKKNNDKKSGKIQQSESNDQETNSDSETKIKGKRKPMTKELSSKKSKAKDLNSFEVRREGILDGKERDCNDSKDDDNWESIFDESGDCLKPEHLEELSRLTGIANPEVQKTQFDYYSLTPKNYCAVEDDEFGHIVEIYDFSPDLNTQDIMQALSSFRTKGFDIKWVDDTHALGIFSSYIAAQDAIQLCSTPLMKLRPISQGTPESRKKASNCFEFLQPYKERPQTSKLLADRLVTGALGMRSKMTREERVKEREKLKEAKNRKRQEELEKAKIWAD